MKIYNIQYNNINNNNIRIALVLQCIFTVKSNTFMGIAILQY